MLLYVGLWSLLFNSLPETFGNTCEDISGRWYNQLGSEVEIDHLIDGKLFGKYYTAVSVAPGAVIGHRLVGVLPYNKPGSSFAFSVTWHNGSSTTIWTAQCQVCNGKEILETSWLLRSYVDSCIDKWKSTLIGKDIFYRKLKSSKDELVRISNENFKTVPERLLTNECSLSGVWYNAVGSEVILNQTNDGTITGEYRTAVEREKGSAGSTHSLVYGAGFPGNTNSTFSLIVVWRDGASVTGWVGQCHICGENNTVILEMNWLLREKVERCTDIWRSTMFGAGSFTRYEQSIGPRKTLGGHTPNRDGEDSDAGSSPKLTVASLRLIFLLLSCNLVMVSMYHS